MGYQTENVKYLEKRKRRSVLPKPRVLSLSIWKIFWNDVTMKMREDFSDLMLLSHAITD
jgi:hypothetical protein